MSGASLDHFVAGATLFSFAAAFLHFILELAVFGTMNLKTAATPLAIAGEASTQLRQLKIQHECPDKACGVAESSSGNWL